VTGTRSRGGASTPELVAAVSNAGGLGSLGCYHLEPAAILRAAADIRRLTDGPFNLNLWIPREQDDPGSLGPSELVVASGFEAGGHRGSFPRPAEQSLNGTFSLVPQVASAVRIPVLAAGGIAPSDLHRAALADRTRARRTALTRAYTRAEAKTGQRRLS